MFVRRCARIEGIVEEARGEVDAEPVIPLGDSLRGDNCIEGPVEESLVEGGGRWVQCDARNRGCACE